MSKKVRSAKGELVNFDLLKIKEQIGSAPPPQDVKLRQDFIEKRLRRRLKKVPAPAPKIEGEEPVSTKMPATENLSEEPKMIDEGEKPLVEVEEPTASRSTTRRQRSKPKAEDNKDGDTKADS